MTLGCGGWGGNITSDNISPKHLLNIKRLAYETQPAQGSMASDGRAMSVQSPGKPAGRPPSAGLDPDRPRTTDRPVPGLARDCVGTGV